MRRNLLGIIAVALLIAGACFWIWPPSASHWRFLHGSCIKIGAVLLVFWLAQPQLVRLPAWIVGAVVGLLILLAVRPQIAVALARYGMVLLPVFFFMWLLYPRRTIAPSQRRGAPDRRDTRQP